MTSSAARKASWRSSKPALYLATAPKSNAAYAAQKAAWRSAQETGSLMPPKSILTAPTRLMKEIGYGRDYAYDYNTPDAFSGSDYWPEEMEPKRQAVPARARGKDRRAHGALGPAAAERRAAKASDTETK